MAFVRQREQAVRNVANYETFAALPVTIPAAVVQNPAIRAPPPRFKMDLQVNHEGLRAHVFDADFVERYFAPEFNKHGPNHVGDLAGYSDGAPVNRDYVTLYRGTHGGAKDAFAFVAANFPECAGRVYYTDGYVQGLAPAMLREKRATTRPVELALSRAVPRWRYVADATLAYSGKPRDPAYPFWSPSMRTPAPAALDVDKRDPIYKSALPHLALGTAAGLFLVAGLETLLA